MLPSSKGDASCQGNAIQHSHQCTSSQWARAKPCCSPAGRQAPWCLPPGGERQTASEANSTASPFHTWWGCPVPAPEGLAGGVPQTLGLRTSSCLAAASDHRKKNLKIEHLLAVVERTDRPCLLLGLRGSRHLGEAQVQPARRPQAKGEEGKRNKYSETQQCEHWLQEQQRQSRLMGRLGRWPTLGHAGGECTQACLQGEQQNLHLTIVSEQGAVMGQGPLRHPIHSSKASIWHPLEHSAHGGSKA